MAYYGNNNGYYLNPNPMQYGQMPMYQNYNQMYQQQQVPVQQQFEENVGFIWVQGKEGAKAYPVAPNKTILLLDSENPYVYKKTADKDGKPIEFKAFKLVEQVDGEVISDKVEFVTKDELEKIEDEISELRETLLDIQTTPDPPRRTRRTS